MVLRRVTYTCAGMIFAGFCLLCPRSGSSAEFVRGDANHDGTVSISDAATLTQDFFVLYPWDEGGVVASCLDAIDTEDDGEPDVIDIIRILQLLFGKGNIKLDRPPPTTFPPPFPTAGEDPSADSLSCDEAVGAPPEQDLAFVIEIGTVVGLAGQEVLVPVYGTTPVQVDAFSLALAYDPSQLNITGFTFTGSVYEELNLKPGGGDYGFAGDLSVTPGAYVLGILDDLLRSVRLPPLDHQVLVNLTVQILPGTSGSATITPRNGVGSPPVSNEYSVIGKAVYAAIHPRLLGGGATVTPTVVDRFRRADVNADGQRDISDAVGILAYLFLGAPAPDCLDAADTDDTGEIKITDAIALLGYLFNGYPGSLPEPFLDCGADLTEDSLGLCLYAASCGDV